MGGRGFAKTALSISEELSSNHCAVFAVTSPLTAHILRHLTHPWRRPLKLRHDPEYQKILWVKSYRGEKR
jgi:hypothetical protein